MVDVCLFNELLTCDSTTGKEHRLADFLAERLLTRCNKLARFDVKSMAEDAPDGYGTPQNLLFAWGVPKLIFCTHLDTVPPYIPPHFEASRVCGRGTCDAKGQILAMWEACKALEDMGMTDFGLLLLAGEETGSFGAKAFNSVISTSSSVIPTASAMFLCVKWAFSSRSLSILSFLSIYRHLLTYILSNVGFIFLNFAT